MKLIPQIIQNYIDSVQKPNSISSLTQKLRPILSRNFILKINNQTISKTDFPELMFNKQYFFTFSKPSIKFLNDNRFVVIFRKKGGPIVKHELYLEDSKIKTIIQNIFTNSKNSNLKGGQGYTYNVSINPVAGKPVITPYNECCAPVFFGSLLSGGSLKQKGGKIGTGYYYDIEKNHLNVLPQYRAYSNINI